MTIRRQSISHIVPGYRVFVYGQDVTEDVMNITITWATGRNVGNCQITMAI
jgi:hypothetical protein